MDPQNPRRGLAICLPRCGRKPLKWTFRAPNNLYIVQLEIEGRPIAEARNTLIQTALEHNCRLLWFVDDDVEPPPDGLLRLVYTMENHSEAAMVSAVYCSKQDPPAPQIYRAAGDGPFWDWAAGVVFEAPGGAGLGCALLRCDWLERMGAPWCQIEKGKVKQGPSEFDLTVGEDLFLCNKLRAAGGRVLVDGGVLCRHHDLKTGRVYVLPEDSLPFRKAESRRQKAEGRQAEPAPAARDGREKFAVVLPQPPGYSHCGALLELAQTVHFGLLHLGFESCLVRGFRSGFRHIVFGSHLIPPEAWPIRADSIIYNTEPLGEEAADAPFKNPPVEAMRAFKVWHMSKSLHERALALGFDSQYVPLGYVREMTRIENQAEPDIDALFYGAVTPRRKAIVDQLRAAGLNVPEAETLFGRYGAERDALMSRAKMILNVHQYRPRVTFAVGRVVYALANRKPVLCEFNGPEEEIEEDLSPGMVFAGYENLIDVCKDLAKDPNALRVAAQAGFDAVRRRDEESILRTTLGL